MTGPVLMYDGISALAAGIARQFPNVTKVAGYINGRYAWSQAEWNLFPHADHVTISITASADAGDVLDVERGDASPDQAHGWIAMRKAAGLYRPTIYCSRSVIPAVRAGTGSYVLGKDYDIWVADYTGSPHQVTAPGLPAATCAATQYESTANWDASMVYDPGWPHRRPPAAPQPAPPPAPAMLPAPAGVSVTPHRIVNASWAPVMHDGKLVNRYRAEIAKGTPDHPVLPAAWSELVDGTHLAAAPVPDGPACFHVKTAADGIDGHYSPWHPIG